MTFRNALTRWTGTLVLAVGLAIYMPEAIIPSAQAMDLTASSSQPTVNYDDTDLTAQATEWRTLTFGADPDFLITDDVNSNTVIELEPSANNNQSLRVDANGDIGLADNSIFIDRSLDMMGIGM